MRTVTVVGRGSVTVPPDMVIATLGTSVQAPQLSTAIDQVDAAMYAVLAALRAHEGGDRDIQTSHFDSGESSTDDDTENYYVRHFVRIRLRDLAGVGATLDAGTCR